MERLPGCWLKRCPNSLPYLFSWFQVQVIEVILNNTFYNVVDMKNLGLTNDKEVSKCSKHNLPGLFRNTQPESIAAVLHRVVKMSKLSHPAPVKAPP